MPVRIVRHESLSESVKTELIISTIETNRDRVRAIGNMLITISGVLIPACLAFLVFFVDKGFIDADVSIFLATAILLLLASSCLSIISSFLRQKYTITNEAQFVEDLLSLLNSEIRYSYIAFFLLLFGISAMIVGVFIFVIKHWR